jgi:RimJ/RimL family protein N-acetyltransferase
MIATLRTPCLDHYVELATWISNAHECLRWAGPKLSYPFSAAQLTQQLETDLFEPFVLTNEQGTLLGFGQLIARDAGTMHLGRIIVAPARRKEGLGKRLCRLLVDQARTQHHATRMTLRVYPDNHAAVATYQALGFRYCQEDLDNEAPLMQLLLAPD